MVMDFGFLKTCMMEVIHNNCDHGTIFSLQDPMLVALLGRTLTRDLSYYREHKYDDLPGWKLYFIPDVPTAENLARVWYERLQEAIEDWFTEQASDITPPQLARLDVWETPNCVASYPSEAPNRAPSLGAIAQGLNKYGDTITL